MSKKKTHHEYVNELIVKNPNLEVLGLYIDAKTKILHRCKKHHEEHLVMPQNALKSGLRCCSRDRYNKIDTISFIRRSREKYGSRFMYDDTHYVNSNTKISITCPDHGIVLILPYKHLEDRIGNLGCQNCNVEKANKQRKKAIFDHATNLKSCADCGSKKSLSDFPLRSNSEDGHYHYCKNCVSLRNRKNKQKKRSQRIKQLNQEFPGAVISSSKYSNLTKKAYFFPETNEKICAKCGSKKHTDHFFKHNQTQDGFHSWCKDCCHLGNKKSIRKKYSSFEGRIPTFLNSCRVSAQKRGQECTITYDDLLELWNNQSGKCFYTAIKMTTQPASHYSVSVERIDSSIGYVKENVVLICHVINRMKSDLDIETFQKMCRAITVHSDGN